jgi:hypothetical protein
MCTTNHDPSFLLQIGNEGELQTECSYRQREKIKHKMMKRIIEHGGLFVP